MLTYYRLGELVMLKKMAIEESETESIPDTDSIASSSMASVYSKESNGSRPSSPSGSQSSGHKFHLPFRSHSHSQASSSDTSEKKGKEDTMCRWLRDGNVVYKSVGLGLMDLVVGMHLITVAREKNMGTQIENF